MINLLKSEKLKLYHKPGTRIMLALLGLGTLLAMAGDYLIAPAREGFWASLAGQSRLTTLLVQFFALIAAAGIVADEYAQGTIKLLLIRPASRGRILFAKYLAILLFVLMALALVAISLLCLNGAVHILGHAGAGAAGEAAATPAGFGLYYLLRGIEIFVYATIAFMLSAVTRSNAFAIGAGFLLILLAPEMAGLFGSGGVGKIFLFSQSNLVRFLAASGHLQAGIWHALAVIAVYLAAFYLAAWWVFVKKDVLA